MKKIVLFLLLVSTNLFAPPRRQDRKFSGYHLTARRRGSTASALSAHAGVGDAHHEDTGSDGAKIAHELRDLEFKAIFDGHGGKHASEAASELLETYLIQEEGFRAGAEPDAMIVAIERAIARLDAYILDRYMSGTTVAATVWDRQTRRVYVIKVGDSDIVLCDKRA